MKSLGSVAALSYFSERGKVSLGQGFHFAKLIALRLLHCWRVDDYLFLYIKIHIPWMLAASLKLTMPLIGCCSVRLTVERESEAAIFNLLGNRTPLCSYYFWEQPLPPWLIYLHNTMNATSLHDQRLEITRFVKYLWQADCKYNSYCTELEGFFLIISKNLLHLCWLNIINMIIAKIY